MKLNGNDAIAIFDSGIGGLTVAKEIMNLLPFESIVYLGDTARYPYGARSEISIKTMALECVAKLLTKNVKVVVVACNTATAYALNTLINHYPEISFIGVVEPSVEAIIASVEDSSNVGIIGTEGTINCGIYEKKLKEKNPTINSYSKACPLLVPLAEEHILQGPILDETLNMYLNTFKDKNISSLILGCTHYPFFRKQIAEFFKNKVNILDSASVTANRVLEFLKEEDLLTTNKKPSYQFMVTDSPDKFKKSGDYFLGRDIERVEKISIT